MKICSQKCAVDVCITDLNKHFKKRVVLNNVSFKVESGAFFLIRGTNGSGKTTLLRIMAGLLEPDSGVVQYGISSPEKARIGYVPQVISPVRYLSGKDILLATGTLHGLGGEYLDKQLENLTYLCGLRQLDNYVGFYSLGMLKKLSLAMSLLNNPQVLLLDEALDALDHEIFDRIINYLKTISEQKRTTVIIVSHKVQEYARVCTDTFVLNNNGNGHQESILESSKRS